MKKIIFIWTLFIFSVPRSSVFSQAFNAEFDRRIILTNSFQLNGAMGVELGFELGVSEYVSAGLLGGFTYIHGPISLEKENHMFLDPEDVYLDEGGYLAIMVNFHYGELIGWPDQWDIYSGINVIKNVGIQTGVRYDLGRLVLLTGEVNIPLIKRLFFKASSWNYIEDYEKPFIRIGFAFGF